jgi:hypothetical protein
MRLREVIDRNHAGEHVGHGPAVARRNANSPISPGTLPPARSAAVKASASSS